jgi:hypothetical protein
MNTCKIFQRIPNPIVAGSLALFDFLIVNKRHAQLVGDLLLRHLIFRSRLFQFLSHFRCLIPERMLSMSYPAPHIPIDPTPSQTAQRQVAAVEALGKELSSVRAELEQLRNEFNAYKADQNRQHEADSSQRKLEINKSERHEFKVAAFSAGLAFLLERVFDLFHLLKG